jgi:hypothetical protein
MLQQVSPPHLSSRAHYPQLEKVMSTQKFKWTEAILKYFAQGAVPVDGMMAYSPEGQSHTDPAHASSRNRRDRNQPETHGHGHLAARPGR